MTGVEQGDTSGCVRRAAVGGALPGSKFPRRMRIGESRVFREAFNSGARFNGRFMTMRVRPGTEGLRIGVIATKRRLKRAVDRSRARRLLREAFRLSRSALRCGCDLVLCATPEILNATSGMVKDEFLSLARQAGLLECKFAKGHEGHS